MEPILKIKNLTKEFKNFKAVDRVSFDVGEARKITVERMEKRKEGKSNKNNESFLERFEFRIRNQLKQKS